MHESSCIKIGKSISCTDDDGEFKQRKRKARTLQLRVVTEDFLVAGKWEVAGEDQSRNHHSGTRSTIDPRDD